MGSRGGVGRPASPRAVSLAIHEDGYPVWASTKNGRLMFFRVNLNSGFKEFLILNNCKGLIPNHDESKLKINQVFCSKRIKNLWVA
jgi:hypothetical protein